MHCSRCGFAIDPEDNYCRNCGRAVNVIDVPALRSQTMPARAWESARPALARGVVLVAAGAMLRILLGQAARVAFPRALPDGGRRLLPFGTQRDGAGEDIEILWYRRVRR
jgi:hypothetical protein